MSEEKLKSDRISPELSRLESELAGLSPAEGINRDDLLFEAGRRAALRQRRTGIGFWKSLSAALAVMLAAQTLLFWPVASESPADTPVADRNVDESPEVRILPDGEPATESAFRPELRASLVVVEAIETFRAGAQYLRLRRLALAEGIDAVEFQPSEPSDQPRESSATQRELLRELLGS